jgi:hypothetical protein
MTDFDKKLKRGINDVKRGIKNLRLMRLEIKISVTENMMGQDINNVYVVDYSYPGGERKIILQKHLFTV